MLLKDNVAIVTGGAQGIGKGIAECLAREGAKVVIFDLNEAGAAEVASEITKNGGKALSMKVDVTNYEMFSSAVDEVHSRWGSIDTLVNNAGILVQALPFMESTEDMWDKLIAADYKSVLYGIKICAKYMIAQNKGRIINIGSDAARHGEPAVAVYAGCKGAVNSSTKSLSKEFAKYNINVNVVSPGLIQTPIIEQAKSTPAGKAMIEATEKRIPLQRMGTPIEVGGAVAFLASDLATYITGQTLSVNGGIF